MGTQAVTDTGPVLHLDEIHSLRALTPWSVVTTPLVAEELETYAVRHSIRVISVSASTTELVAQKHDIALAESSAIALALTQKTKLFFTDDLDAREAAHAEGLEPHGSLGILIAAYAKGVATKEQTIKAIHSLEDASTLFITKKLIQEALHAIERHSKSSQR